jgi:hypothetical protein
MNVELLKKTRVGRLLRVRVPSGDFMVEYSGYGFGFESVVVDGKIAARATSWVRMVPRFDFPVGPHAGVIKIRTRLWRDLLGPLLGRLESFQFELDGQLIYQD